MTATQGHAATRLPDTMLRQDIGPYVRSLREYFGLTQQDVAARLHLRLKYVQAIEASQFEQLPGAVYAKGYVHTYATFLGLDADQVVDKCFGVQPVRDTQEHFIPAGAQPSFTFPKPRKQWLVGAIAVLVVAGLYNIITTPSSKEEVAVVSEKTEVVPEDLLAPMRRAVMATPANHDCLAGRSGLACFFDSGLTRRWVVPEEPPSYAGIAAANAPSKAKKK